MLYQKRNLLYIDDSNSIALEKPRAKPLHTAFSFPLDVIGSLMYTVNEVCRGR